MSKKAIVFDFSHLVHRVVFANLKDIRDTPDFLTHVLLTSMLSNIRQFNKEKDKDIIIATDCSKKDNWRTHFYENNKSNFPEYENQTYKGNRDKSKMDVPWDMIYEKIDELLIALTELTDFKVISNKNSEADDIINVVSKEYDETIIISSDKDFHQLISETTQQYDPLKKKFIKLEEDSDLLLKKHILTGQGRKDNIFPCRKKLGPKTADKLLEYLDSHLEADDELRKRYMFNKRLIDLTEFPKDLYNIIKDKLNEEQYNFSSTNLLTFLIKNNLKTIVKDVSVFNNKIQSTSLY